VKILSFGAGAIGTYVGGSLALAGHIVVFLERPEIAQKLQNSKLTLHLSERSFEIPNPQTASSIEEAVGLGPFDIGLFALKSFDTEDAIKSMKPFQKDLPPILCLQNGVENELVLQSVLGPDRVIAGTVTSAIGRSGLGNIRLERQRGVGLAGNHPFSKELFRVFNQAGLNAQLFPIPADMKWSKMLTNLLANASSAILNIPPGTIFSHPDLFRLEIRQLREALAVMKVLDISTIDLPGTPVRLLSFAVEKLPLKLANLFLKRAVGSGRGGKMPSFHIDLHSGRGKTEVEYLNGAVVRYGEKLQIPTPVNRTLTNVLIEITNKQIPVEQFSNQPNKFLTTYAKELAE